MAMFRQVKINIPLIDSIAQIPRYAKFLKEFCTSKKKLKGTETVRVGENVSSILQKRLPQKCEDPRVFTVPCKLGNLHVPRAMIDLGASINVLPFSIYKSLGLGTLTRTGINIKLADRSIVYPKGVLDDVLVQVNGLVFPADFYVLDMDDDDAPNPNSILLGRPFLKTAKTKIDVYNGTLSMEFDGDVINFNISATTKHPNVVHDVNSIDVIQPLTDECFDITNNEVQALDLSRNLAKDTPHEHVEKKELKGVMEKEVCENPISKMMVDEKAVCECLASTKVIDEKVKKKRKRRKWKWLKVSFPCALKA